MSETEGASGKLRTLRERVASAKSPAEGVQAKLLLAEEIWLSEPTAAAPLLEQVVSEAREAGQIRDSGRAASMLSELLRRAGDLDGSMRYAELVFKDAELTGDRRGRASALNLVGLVCQERGELDRAIECFEEFQRISRETGFLQGEQSALNQLAGVHGLRGELDKALACYRQCLELSDKAGDTFGRAIHLHNIGWTLKSLGNWTAATEHLHRAIALCEEHGFRDLLLSSRMELGELSLKRSDYENARLMFDAVINAEQESQQHGRLYRQALSNLGWMHFYIGNLAKAEDTLAEAARLCETTVDRRDLAIVCRRRAEVALAQGRLDAVGEFLEQAARHAADLKLRTEQGEVQRVEALLSAARSDTNSALELLARSESTLEPLGDTFELALTRLEHGRLLLNLDRSEQALSLLQTAAGTFRRLSVVAEAEDVARLLYRLEVQTDRDAALVRGLDSLNSLNLGPELFAERALTLLCDGLQFEQGAVLVDDHAVALKGNPDLTKLPKRRLSRLQTDLVLLLPVRQDRRFLGLVWFRRNRPLAGRVGAGLLERVSRAFAPSLAKLGELDGVETHLRAHHIPGLRFRGIVGRSPEVLDVLKQVPRIAAAARPRCAQGEVKVRESAAGSTAAIVPVLVQGETGSGKELVARALHESSPRADRPFITVNCAAVPENLLEAEFFGVEAGAATGVAARPGKFELAHTGTVFLDEIGDMSPALQAKLLRVIEDCKITRVGGTKETTVDVWVIAATNMDLEARAARGKFRPDLLYRLNAVPLILPPLRRRGEDIPTLTNYFITRMAQQHNRDVRRASDDVLALFSGYAWPGNIRQLRHAVERAVLLATSDTLRIDDLPPRLRALRPASTARPSVGMRGERHKAATEAERAMLLEALAQSKGNISKAAEVAGYSRTQFYRLLRKHHITTPGASA